jgi:hypothetical protein
MGRAHARRLTLSGAEQQALVDKHNALRAAVNQPCTAADMQTMSWDDSLASLSANWGANCLWEHDPQNQADGTGENLAMSWSSAGNSYDTDKLTGFVQNWYDEIEDTEWSSDWKTVSSKIYADPATQCKSPDGTGKCMIGHYTAVVWASSNKVGCAVTTCSSGLVNDNGGVYLVCKYTPAGNMASPSGGTNAPFTPGAICGACNQSCSEPAGLCQAGSANTCGDTITTMTFNNVPYTSCSSLVAGTAQFGNNYWCSNQESQYEICQQTCGICSKATQLGADFCGVDASEIGFLTDGCGRQACSTTLALVVAVFSFGAIGF